MSSAVLPLRSPPSVPKDSASPPRRWLPTTDATWVFVALAVVAALSLLLPIQPEDFWWNMAIGRITWQTGRLPATDVFSYTQPGQPFFVHGWLPQVVFYLLYTAGGATLILLVQAGVLTTTYALLVRSCVRRGASPRLAALLLLAVAVPLSASNWNVRPQSYALILCVLMLSVLTRWWKRPEPVFTPAFFRGGLWLLPVLMLVWVNTHGSFVLGGILIALTFAAEIVRRALQQYQPRWVQIESTPGPNPSLTALCCAGGLAAAMIPLNPTGLDIIRFTLACANDPDRRINSVEWRPPVVMESDGPVFFAAVLVLLAVLALARRRPSLVDLFQLAGFFWVGLQGVRYIVWFPLVLVPILTELLAAPRQSDTADRSPMNWLFIALAVGCIVAVLPPLKPQLLRGPNRHLLSADTPVAAVEALRALPARPRRLFHSCSAGSYLMWAAPEQGVFIDSRLQDFYGPKLVADYCALTAGERVPELLAEYQIDGLLLSRQQHRHLLTLLEAMPEWHAVYADQTHVMFMNR